MTESVKQKSETITIERPNSTRTISPPRTSQYLHSSTKRIVDICFGLVGFALLIAIFPFVAILIKTTSRGPVFYRQDRVGKSQSIFKLVKFRSMYDGSEVETGAVWASEDDSRITFVGKLLRLTYLDEFPQFWNVLRGEMSIVGPRPERPEIISKIRDDIPRFDMRLACKPGITGLAQINLGYGNTIRGARYKLRYDLIYIGVSSLAMDFKIIVRTVVRAVTQAGT